MSYRYVDTPEALAEVIQAASAEPVYALDTEFHRERTYFAQLALVQIAWADQVALIDPLAIDVTPLRALLEGDGTCIIHAASQDLEILARDCGAVPKRLFDPQVAASFIGLGTPSLGRIVHELLDIQLKKGAQLSDWTRRPLGRAELDYAASDVLYLVELHEALLDRLDELGRRSWCEEECERVRTVDRSPPQLSRAWWKLKGKARFRGKSAAMVQSVAAWRLETAIHDDRPIRHVLPDVTLLSIAERPPKDERALNKVRGMQPRYLKGGRAQALWQAIERGRRLPLDEVDMPKAPRTDKAPEALAALCLAWANQKSADESIEQRVLGTRDEITTYLVQEEGSPLAKGWRHEMLGKDLLRIKRGEVLLGVAAGGERLVLRPA